MLPLPHTAGCLVCGKENQHGLHLDLFFDSENAVVRTTFTPLDHHIGFTGIAHGGALATVLDEAMVWAASYLPARFCYCGEMTVRFRRPATVGVPMAVEARVLASRSRLITTAATLKTDAGELIAEGSGKYIPMTSEQDAAIKKTLIAETGNNASLAHLLAASSTSS